MIKFNHKCDIATEYYRFLGGLDFLYNKTILRIHFKRIHFDLKVATPDYYDTVVKYTFHADDTCNSNNIMEASMFMFDEEKKINDFSDENKLKFKIKYSLLYAYSFRYCYYV